jgi:hypothetical protein
MVIFGGLACWAASLLIFAISFLGVKTSRRIRIWFMGDD